MSFILTRPTKNRTATFPERTASYCIQVLRTAILRLKLFAVENIPIKRSMDLFVGTGGAFNISKSVTCSKSYLQASHLLSQTSRLIIGSSGSDIFECNFEAKICLRPLSTMLLQFSKSFTEKQQKTKLYVKPAIKRKNMCNQSMKVLSRKI